MGVYTILDVLPGTYTLSIAQAGNFGGFTQKNITVEVNQQVRIDMSRCSRRRSRRRLR